MPEKKIQFLGEGNVEKVILNYLEIPDNLFEKSNGIHGVAKDMTKHQNNSNIVIVGIIDKDKKNTPRYFDDFDELTEKSNHNLLYKKHPENEHYLIIVCPKAMELWLLQVAMSNNVSPSEFNLPDVAKELKKVTRSNLLSENQDFKNFLFALLETPQMQTLKSWLQEFTITTQ